MTKLTTKKLDFWINNNLNVLLIGDHGIGKTALIKETFDRHNLKCRYFSASTMDPWVDFIGVPKEVKGDDGISRLELIRPAEFQDDSIEIIFFDEFNRAAAKTRNAVMELLQFKSINGRKFHNLRAVWAAINHYDDEETYDVEQLDPAQQDRFHVIYTLPNKPSRPYFTEQYGSTIANNACDWWDMLPDTSKKLVSPRRLDYAIDIYLKGGDLTDVLDRNVRPKTLKALLERVETTTMTHDDHWLQNPDMYIMELSSRNSKHDVVGAFDSLQNISFDQSVSYVRKLPLSQLTKLATDSRTAYIVLQALKYNKQEDAPSRQLITALKKNKISDIDVNQMIVEHVNIQQESNQVLYNIIKQTEQSSAHTTSWKTMLASVTSMINNDEFSHSDAILVTLSCLSRIAGIKHLNVRNQIINTVIHIIELVVSHERSNRPDKMLELISIDIESIIRVYTSK